mgnify:CR=1 FL=1
MTDPTTQHCLIDCLIDCLYVIHYTYAGVLVVIEWELLGKWMVTLPVLDDEVL